MQPLATLDIYHDYSRYIKHGLKSEVKYLNNDHLINVFKNEIAISPFMPTHIVFFKHSHQNSIIMTSKFIGMYNVEIRADQTEYESFSFHFPYMNFLWTLKQNNDKYNIRNTYLYISFMPPGQNTMLYIPNLNNVDSGKICWGSVTNKAFYFTEIGIMQNQFFEARHNLDYVSSMWGQMKEVSGKIYQNEQEWANSPLIQEKFQTFGDLYNSSI